MNFQRFLQYENILKNEMPNITLMWFGGSCLRPFIKKNYIALSADSKYQQKPINSADREKYWDSGMFRLTFNASQAITFPIKGKFP